MAEGWVRRLLPYLHRYRRDVLLSFGAALAGLSVTFSDQTFAGQASKCVNWAYQGQSAKYCVTNSGILAFAGGARTSGAGSFELSEYSTNVPDGDFNLPAGATVETIPSATSTT